VAEFETEVNRILAEVEEECGWMYETRDKSGRIGRINYTVWSDVFVCPECAGEVVFWDEAVDRVAGKVLDKFPCPHCQAELTKRGIERAWVTKYDMALKNTIRQAKQIPVLIIYSINGLKGRLEKKPDDFDLENIEKIEKIDTADWYPTAELPDGYNTRQPIRSHGMDHVHHFYTIRNLAALSNIFSKIVSSRFKFLFTGFVGGATKLNQFHLKNYVFGGGGFNPGPRKGTLYAPSISMEAPILSLCKDRLRTQIRAYRKYANTDKVNLNLSTASCANVVGVKSDSLDYIFIDPPFGANLNYSELSFIWENWLKVITDNKTEAIENSVQGKPLQTNLWVISGTGKLPSV